MENFTSKKVVLTDNQYRLFFAAFYNDLAMLNALKYLGWDVNIEDRTRRTPLQIASSQGNIDAVMILLGAGADITAKDARGNDALDDAIREGKTSIVDTLIDRVLVRDQCKTFENSLFSKGFSSAVGVFNRKFSDVEITLQDTKNKALLLSLLGATKIPGQTTNTTVTNSTTNGNKASNSTSMNATINAT